ncbi:hypothetical protein FB45DRAFT_935134 [Roridomyces roridus]|uniref:Fungal calcium binding protein domain-containing protein n=1 Tax=Roridomyces roridus TaxID=1738132 RepID=A0AAD7BBG1_9AGAR|nr:hypothetical protein FB45DRAFT_935134 [Roridomyces roridus]
MQFSIVALVAFFAASAIAAPTTPFRRDCSVKQCVLDLAPSAVSCATAAAQVDLDPISDVSCLIAAAKDVTEFPASCSACF